MKAVTGPHWLFELFNNVKNEKGTAKIIPILDKYDRPIVGINVLKDPDWSDLGKAKNPDGKTVNVIDVVEIIDFEPKEDEDLINLESKQLSYETV